MSTAVDSIIEKLDIVDYISNVTKLRKSGNSYRGVCPIHGGKNGNSLAVFPADNSFHCFSCGATGNIINFVAAIENISYSEAIEMLAREANIDVSKDKEYQKQKTMYEKNQAIANKCFKQQAVIADYMLNERGLTKETIDAFYVGYDNSKSKGIIIPLHDKNGRIVAFCKRNLDSLPKYINSSNNELYDKSEFLFNSYRARTMINKSKKLFIVEGYLDCMSAYQQGLACVAYCGSELTQGQIQQIRGMTHHFPNTVICFAPDNDKVGQSKIPRVYEKFRMLAPKLDVRVVAMPDGCKDFNDTLLAGKEINRLKTEPISFSTIRILLDDCVDVQQEYNVAADFLNKVNNPINKSELVKWLSVRWKKDIEDVRLLTSLEDTDEEILKEFSDIDTGFADYLELISREPLGTGFASIDKAVSIRPTEVVLWGGYSGTFKTMFAVEIALHNAIRMNRNVLFFSLEMSAGALYERIISRLLHKSSKEVEEMAKDGSASIMLQNIKEKLNNRIKVLDATSLTMEDVEKRIALANSKIWENGKTDLVILDYFQYLKANTFEEVAAAAKNSKVIAKKFDIAFYIISQLNRTGDNYAKPTIKMLKGSGDLEASGDWIFLSWRPDMTPKLSAEEYLECKDHICVSVGKARRGALATEFEFRFDKEKSYIEDLSAKEGGESTS